MVLFFLEKGHFEQLLQLLKGREDWVDKFSELRAVVPGPEQVQLQGDNILFLFLKYRDQKVAGLLALAVFGPVLGTICWWCL